MSKESDNYILAKGDIEDYFPEGLKSKDLDNVLVLLSDDGMQKWRGENPTGFSSLTKIVKEIVDATVS